MYSLCVVKVLFVAALFCGGARGQSDPARRDAEMRDALQQYDQTIASLTSRINQQDDIIADLSVKLNQQDDIIAYLSAKEWEIHESSDCYGNDWGRQEISTAEECLQHCINDYSNNGCVAVVFGYNSARGYECHPKRTCSNITPLQNYDTYTRIHGNSAELYSNFTTQLDEHSTNLRRDMGEILRPIISSASDVREELDVVKADTDNFENLVEELQEQAARHEELIAGNTVDHESLKAAFDRHTDFVGFTAYMTGGWQEPNNGDVVRFTRTVSNAGGAYSTATSHFTCPVSGYYYVTFSLHTVTRPAYGYGACIVEIVMDDTVIVEGREWIHGVNANANQQNTMTQSVVLYCAQGSDVRLRSDHDQCSLYGDETYRRSTFSGVLLHAA